MSELEEDIAILADYLRGNPDLLQGDSNLEYCYECKMGDGYRPDYFQFQLQCVIHDIKMRVI